LLFGDLLIELDDEQCATREVDAERQAPGGDHADAAEDDRQRQGEGVPFPAQEVVVGGA
jgi:hypothetical protein